MLTNLHILYKKVRNSIKGTLVIHNVRYIKYIIKLYVRRRGDDVSVLVYLDRRKSGNNVTTVKLLFYYSFMHIILLYSAACSSLQYYNNRPCCYYYSSGVIKENGEVCFVLHTFLVFRVV